MVGRKRVRRRRGDGGGIFVVGRWLSWLRRKDGFGMGLDVYADNVIGLALAESLPSPVSRGDLLPNLQSLSFLKQQWTLGFTSLCFRDVLRCTSMSICLPSLNAVACLSVYLLAWATRPIFYS